MPGESPRSWSDTTAEPSERFRAKAPRRGSRGQTGASCRFGAAQGAAPPRVEGDPPGRGPRAGRRRRLLRRRVPLGGGDRATLARDAGWALESRIHVVADGAERIALQSREVFGDLADLLVDFYHVSEYLAADAEVCRPKSPRSWLHTQQKRLRRGAPLRVIEAMEPFAEPQSDADADPPVRAAIRYLRNRLQCLDYPKALSRDLPIGSGLIESGHKHVLQARHKKAVCAWLPAHADAMAQLRVLRAN